MDALKAMKQALEACRAVVYDYPTSQVTLCDEAMTALATAIAEMEKAEPVAWHYKEKLPFGYRHHFTAYAEDTTGDWTPLYVSPPLSAVSLEPIFKE